MSSEMRVSGQKTNCITNIELASGVLPAADWSHYLGDDCMLYTVAGYGQDEMYARCGDHGPVFLDHVPDHQTISMVSDPLQLNGTTMDVVEVKRRAIQGISNPR